MPTKTAKLFSNGRSQAVRLPAEFRFEGDEVYIRKDAVTGDVILSAKDAGDWQAFFAVREDVPPDYLAERPGNEPLQPRGELRGRK
ncbi:MAG: AbrB/MazE/SpoVT family DNA-binding domain-containing protein [Gammaproteobacteria bacterium]|nr:AbrB/MazE/SpoVT family DNA-binding domain-containing protein [Gammaproteobacteria bacterium]